MMSCVTLGTALLYTQWSGVDRHAGVCQHVVCRARTVHQLPPGGSAAVNTASPLWYTGGSSWSVISRDICVLFWIRVCFLLSVTENLRGVVKVIYSITTATLTTLKTDSAVTNSRVQRVQT